MPPGRPEWLPLAGHPGLYGAWRGSVTRFPSEKWARKGTFGRADRTEVVKIGTAWFVRWKEPTGNPASPAKRNPTPTNDYRSGATRESTPLHIWWSNVLDLAGVTHAQSLPHRAQVNRWYQAGEPAWMAADGLRLLANARPGNPRRNPEVTTADIRAAVAAWRATQTNDRGGGDESLRLAARALSEAYEAQEYAAMKQAERERIAKERAEREAATAASIARRAKRSTTLVVTTYSMDFTSQIQHARRSDGQWFRRTQYRDPRYGYKWGPWKASAAPEKQWGDMRSVHLPKGYE
jgi:hypothetical protein